MSYAPVLDLYTNYAGEVLRRQDESWQSPTPEAFHQLRVYIKRMRALLSLVATISGSTNLRKRVKVFRDVFNSAGRVRDLHVQIDLIRGVEEDKGTTVVWYREQLEQRERDAIQSFLCKQNVMLRPSDLRSVRKAVETAMSGKTSVHLAAEAWGHFGRCLTRTIEFDVDSKDLHDLRKRAKEASNLTWILEQTFPQVELDQTLKSMLDDMQNQLGKWHDFEIAVVWAEELPDDAIQGDRETWRSFVHNLRHRRGVLRAKVIRRWRKLAESRKR